jgi:hypothetical protein
MDPEERSDWDARSHELIRYFQTSGNAPKDARIGDKVAAIEIRLRALASLRDRPELKRWTVRVEDGCDAIHHVLLEAAAVEPLVEVDKYHLTFDPSAFADRVLRMADMDGVA